MSTEPTNPAAPKPDPLTGLPAAPPATTAAARPASHGPEGTGIGERLGRGWDAFKQGKVVSYRWMALLLLVVTVVGVGYYIWWERKHAESAKWVAYTELKSLKEEEDFENQYAHTTQARLARLNRLRVLLVTNGIEVLRATEAPPFRPGQKEPDMAARQAEHAAAAASVEKARELADKFAEELKDDPVGRVQCLWAGAMAEEALIGVSKEGSSLEFRGSVDQLVSRLEKVASAEPQDDVWVQKAKKRLEELKNPANRDALVTIQTAAYTLKTRGLPGGPGSGGFPPGGPTIPGLPGGGPDFGP